MSNPSINRWGLNLFWYRFWYNDKLSSSLYRHDDLINELLILYFFYGVSSSQDIIINKYWYKNFLKFDNYFYKISNTKYFRFVEYKNRIINEYRTFRIRIKFKNLYFSKIWIMRYQGWLLILLCSYQPFVKNMNKKISLKKTFDLFTHSNKISKKSVFFRYRFLIFFYFNFLLSKKSYYNF